MSLLISPKKNQEQIFINKGLIHEIADIMDERNLSEIEIEKENHKIRVCRKPATIASDAISRPQNDLKNSSSKSNKPNSDLNTTEPPSQKVDNANIITSPMVGIIYMRPDPESKNFILVSKL